MIPRALKLLYDVGKTVKGKLRPKKEPEGIETLPESTTAYPKWGKDVVDPEMVKTAKESAFTAYPRWGGQAGRQELPEFTTENLSKVLRKEGVDPNMDKLGWGGRFVSDASSPTKYKNIKFEDLNQAQQDVYKAIRDMKGYGDLPAKELEHPGVLSDLLEEAGRAGDKIYRYQGDSPPAYAFISNYWRKKGPMIRKEWNTVQETGDFTTGTSFEEIIEGIKRID
jgi:hypothetical protein